MGFKLRVTAGPNQFSGLPDMQAVRRALMLFLDIDHFVFLQALPSASMACFPANEWDAISGWISTHADERGLYFGINPIEDIRPRIEGSGGKKGSLVGDVVRRRWILIDIDRNKTMQPNDPATDNEHEDAKELAFEIMSYLSDVGFPAPAQVDSGNGFHLYYKVDMPNDTEHRDLVHDFLKLLDNTFSNEKGKVGHEVFDARRISRMPGSWSRRGEASKERPYRQCKFVYTPIDGGVVPTELIRRVVSDDKAEQQRVEAEDKEPTVNYTIPDVPLDHPKRNGFILPITPAVDRDRAYGLRAIDDECAKLACCPKGDRHNQLVKSAYNLWELCAGKCLTAQEVKDALFKAACACGLDQDKDYGGDKGIIRTIDSCREKGMGQPRNATSKDPDVNGKKSKAQDKDEPKVDASQRIITLASEITPRKIQWLWQGRIPLGMMTTFAGSGGLGKTFVLTDIAARVSRGDVWPDGVSGNTPGKVLYVSGEDNPDDTLVPRLIAAGGNRDNVAYLKPEILGQFSLKRRDLLDMALDQLGDGVQLVCIDPPTSFLAGTDDHKNSELRELLTPLSEWASIRRVAVVFITHINKGGAGKVDAVMRIIGSVAWSTAVRAAHMFCEDPDDHEKCLFLVAKINGAKKRKGIAYRIHQLDANDTDGPARVEWLGEVDTTANEAMGGQTKVLNRRQSAAQWLIEKFREKLVWQADELFLDAKNNGISRNAIFEAKEDLNLPKAKKTILPNGISAWCWWVPEDWEKFNVEGDEKKAIEDDHEVI